MVYNVLLFIAILHHPASLNKTIGGFAEFNCSVEGQTLVWIVDGYPLDHWRHNAKGYNEVSSSNNGVIYSSLKTHCNPSDNNTMIKCLGYGENDYVSSAEVTLLLQGNISYCINV